MSRKPHIVLIPGAWHTGACYDVIVPLLEDAGYSTTALTLPSVGAEPPVTSTNEDVAFTHSTVSSLVDAGKDVVVVMHSYGAIPGSDAMIGLSKSERSGEGLEGGVVALVYICAWMMPEGKCIADYPRSPTNRARLRFEVGNPPSPALGSPSFISLKTTMQADANRVGRLRSSH
jgi:pimeloyl-ACP methyl ester carboxylesterase